ncbi:hypothetical protein [Spirosoma flavum]|uniref:Glycine zipper family protein n=1 Tax=Spirosoma flavum TaxID=2048557 RepID=A0ABW6ASV8_9BACT
MNQFLLRCLCLTMLLILSIAGTLFAQKPAIDAYRIKVVTTRGHRFRGVLDDINDTYLYIIHERNSPRQVETIPLDAIRKVVIRRNSKTTVNVTGAIVGGLIVSFLAEQSLQKNPTRSPVAHGVTLTFAAAGGAAGGLLLGSAIGNATSRVVRPYNNSNLLRQLEPYSMRYQQDLINRLPKNSQ